MSNYSNYNGYYSNRKPRIKLDIPYSPEYPSTRYRVNKPELKDFGLQSINIDALLEEYDRFSKERDKLESYMYVLIFCGIFVVPILFGYNLQILGVLYIVIVICLNIYKNKKTFEYQKEYDQYLKYSNALEEYNFWQKRKVESFWFGLNGREFEKEVCKIFNSLGYKAYLCKQGGDGGVDIDLYSTDRKYSIVQCKAHKKKIAPSVARDLYGTMTSKKASKAYLVTLLGGTEGTIDFCKKNNIILWDINDLIRYTKENKK